MTKNLATFFALALIALPLASHATEACSEGNPTVTQILQAELNNEPNNEALKALVQEAQCGNVLLNIQVLVDAGVPEARAYQMVGYLFGAR